MFLLSRDLLITCMPVVEVLVEVDVDCWDCMVVSAGLKSWVAVVVDALAFSLLGSSMAELAKLA